MIWSQGSTASDSRDHHGAERAQHPFTLDERHLHQRRRQENAADEVGVDLGRGDPQCRRSQSKGEDDAAGPLQPRHA